VCDELVKLLSSIIIYYYIRPYIHPIENGSWHGGRKSDIQRYGSGQLLRRSLGGSGRCFPSTIDKFDGLPDKTIMMVPNNAALSDARKAINLTEDDFFSSFLPTLEIVLQHHIGDTTKEGEIFNPLGDEVTLEVDGTPVDLAQALKSDAISITVEGTTGPVDATGTAALQCVGGDQIFFPVSSAVIPEEILGNPTNPIDLPGVNDAVTGASGSAPSSGGRSARFAAGAMSAIMGFVATIL